MSESNELGSSERSSPPPMIEYSELVRKFYRTYIIKWPDLERSQRPKIETEILRPLHEKQITEIVALERWEKLVEDFEESEQKSAADDAAATETEKRHGRVQPYDPPEQRSTPAQTSPEDDTSKSPVELERAAHKPAGRERHASEDPPAVSAPTRAERSAADPQTKHGAAISGSDAPDQSEPPRPTPQWQVLEPEDRADPVQHSVCFLERRNDTWRIMGASVRGKLHAHRGLWREDAMQWGFVGEWTILVVSDGAGSAKLSRVGARLACEHSMNELRALFEGYSLSPSGGQPAESDLLRVRAFLARAALKAQEALFREAKNRECSPKDFHATLLLMAHTPFQSKDFVAAIQVGDGAIGIYTADKKCTVLGIADHGEFSSETRFLTTPNIDREFEHRVLFTLKENVQCLAVMCDGVADDFFPEEKRLVQLFDGDPIDGMVSKGATPQRGVLLDVLPEPNKGQRLVEWLGYERRGSSDDRTLLLMYRSDRS